MNWVIISSGNSLSPVRCQAITRTNADLLSIGLLGTIYNEIWIGILSFSFKKMHLKMSSANMTAILSRGRWVNTLTLCSTLCLLADGLVGICRHNCNKILVPYIIENRVILLTSLAKATTQFFPVVLAAEVRSPVNICPSYSKTTDVNVITTATRR